MGVEFEKEVEIEGENVGSTFIMFSDEQKGVAEIVKKKLIYPGSAKIIYFLVNELRNDKIKAYINEHGK
jgi:acid stress-induced BolA-like protein IbaG/YrbA